MKPPPPPPIPKPRRAGGDILARSLAGTVRNAFGEGSAATLDMSEQLGSPRGWIGTRNIAMERALGAPGIPMGRIIEISGWEAAGKSTVADQIIAEAQSQGGVGILADVERARNRDYMARLGVQAESTIWLGARTIEDLFGEMEILIRQLASMNAIAWRDALRRVGVKVEPLGAYTYTVMEGRNKAAKPVAKHQFYEWGRAQAGALLDWQRASGLAETSIRDDASRAILQPVVIHIDDSADKRAQASEAQSLFDEWKSRGGSDRVQLADRPVVAVWDSVAGTPTREELEGQAEDVHPATAAKVIRRNLRRLVQLIDDEAVAVVLVNQRYERIPMGGPGKRLQGGSETYGGGGIKYHTTIRVELTKIGSIKEPGASDDDWAAPPMGQIVSIRVPKNKVETPFHEEKFGLIYGRGADNAWALYEDLRDRGVISQAGGWSRFTDPTILGAEAKSFHGWTELSNLMASTPGLWERLRAIYLEGR